MTGAVLLAAASASATVALDRTALVSSTASGAAASGASTEPTISGSGRLMAFTSTAPDAAANDGNGAVADVVLADLAAGSRQVVSVRPDGGPADGPSGSPVLSKDGRALAFVSSADDLVAGDTDGVADVFVRGPAGVVVRVSAAPGGGQPNGPSGNPAISANGRFVAFSSMASNLVPGDTNGVEDVFLADLAVGTLQRISVAGDGTQGNGPSTAPAISANGFTISFASKASNLVPGDRNGVEDVFVRDVLTGSTQAASLSDGDRQQNAAVAAPFHQISDVSADGRYVVFDSDATNLVAGDVNRHTDVFVRDLTLQRTTMASLTSGNVEGDNDSFAPTITPDGRHVAFESFAGNLAPGNGPREDVFVRDLVTKRTNVIDVPSRGGVKGPELVRQLLQRPVLTADGMLAAFTSTTPGLAGPDGNGSADVFLRNMTPAVGRIVAVSRASAIRPALRLAADDPQATSFLCRLPRRPAFRCPVGRNFRVPALPPGTYTMRIYAGGPGLLYQPRPLRVTVRIRRRS